MRGNIKKVQKKKAVAVIMSVVCILAGCSQSTASSSDVQTQEDGATSETVTTQAQTVATQTTTVIDSTGYTVEYSDRDYDADWSDEDTVVVNLTDATVSGDGVEVQGTTMTITAAGTYVFTGSTSEGNIVVNAPECKIRIVLKNANLTSSKEAPIAIFDSKKVVITLAEGTQNEITDARQTDVDDTTAEESTTVQTAAGEESQTQEESEEESDTVCNAAIYAKENLTFNGTGKLTVVSSNNNGITSKDELIFMEGTYEVTAAGHGITGKDYLAVASGEFAIQAGKDGMRASNTEDEMLGFVKIETGTIQIAAGDDGIHAQTWVFLENGEITITESYEGIEGAYISISGGTISVTASDDGINATTGTQTMMMGPNGNENTVQQTTQSPMEQTQEDARLIISGGEIYVNAGGDGLDANGYIEQTGGRIFVSGSEDGGNAALDYDRSYTMTGGTLIASGNATMLQTISDDSGVYCVTLYYDTMLQAGTEISVTDQTGAELLNDTAVKAFNSLVIASDLFAEEMEVTITAGDEVKTAVLSDYMIRIMTDDSVETGAVTSGPGGMAGGMQGGMKGNMQQGDRPSENRENSASNGFRNGQ